MREQIDLFRSGGFGDLRTLANTMSTQVAMIRYLDNNHNRSTSPNQNFARELMELFLLGVGNYTEADVEAATAAWTGHTDNWETDQYVWRADWHDRRPRRTSVVTINAGPTGIVHGYDTIRAMLGGRHGAGHSEPASNRGRLTGRGRRRVPVPQDVDVLRRHDATRRRDRGDPATAAGRQ